MHMRSHAVDYGWLQCLHLHAGFTASDEGDGDDSLLQDAPVADLLSEADVLQVSPDTGYLHRSEHNFILHCQLQAESCLL